MDLPASEWWLRFGAFAAVFAVMALAEHAAPARKATAEKQRRWIANLGLLGVNTLAVRLLFPGAAVGIALLAERNGSGLLHIVAMPEAVAVVVSLLILDLGIYLQHVLFHGVPALWRLHSVHHADLEFDITTASRFHPLEMLLSMLIKAAIIFAIGTPWLAVLIFEVILNATAVFNHANVRLPPSAERWLRRIVVTPDMHLIHHSVLAEEHNSNFGFNLSCWDRLFGTYCPEWRGGPSAPIVIGLAQQRQCANSNFMTLLAMPFQRDALRGRTIASPRDIKSDRAAASPDSLR